jgi:hypothetical protein
MPFWKKRRRGEDSEGTTSGRAPLLDLAAQVIATGEGEIVRRPPEEILLARGGYERYVDSKLAPEHRLATELIPGLEEAWDSLADDVEPLLEYGGMGAGPGAGWSWTIAALDIGDGLRIYTEMRSGNAPSQGVFLIGVTTEGSSADRLVEDAFLASENGRALEAGEDDEDVW